MLIHGMRLPAIEEMQHSQSIGMSTPMAPGDTYQQAVANWATYQCNSGGARAHPGFCEWSYTVGNEKADGWEVLWVIVVAALLAIPSGGGVGAVAKRPQRRYSDPAPVLKPSGGS